MKSIDKPGKLKSRASVGFLLVVIIIGFMAGILGQIILLSYGSDIPYLEKLDIFSWTNEQSLFVGNRNNDGLSLDQQQKVIYDVNSSIVQIFEYKEVDNSLEALYIPSESLGNGYVLTNDGYVVTTNNILVEDKKIVVITNDKEVYLVNNIIADSATDFVFLETDAVNLQTFDIIDRESLNMMSEIVLVKTYGFNHSVQTQRVSIADNYFTPISGVSDFVKSSSRY